MKTHLHGFWNIIQVPLSAHTENLNICYKQFGLHTHQATKVQRFGRLSEWNHRKLVPDSIKTKTPSPSLLITQGCDGVTGTVLIGGDPLHVIIKETHRRMNMVLHRHRSIPPPKLKDYLKNSRFHSKARRNKEGVCVLLRDVEEIHIQMALEHFYLNWATSVSTFQNTGREGKHSWLKIWTFLQDGREKIRFVRDSISRTGQSAFSIMANAFSHSFPENYSDSK